jgi:hypothetical protein
MSEKAFATIQFLDYHRTHHTGASHQLFICISPVICTCIVSTRSTDAIELVLVGPAPVNPWYRYSHCLSCQLYNTSTCKYYLCIRALSFAATSHHLFVPDEHGRGLVGFNGLMHDGRFQELTAARMLGKHRMIASGFPSDEGKVGLGLSLTNPA